MDYQQLSDRLEAVATHIQQGDFIADIGSDHAYLPAYLMLKNQISGAIAGEVVEGPYESAKHLVESLNLIDKISVRLGDGLAVIKPTDQVTAITICGMGGTLIRDILDRGIQHGVLTGKERLILQPNVGEKILRQWLVSHNYQIVDEELIEENHKFYEIIVAEKATEMTELTSNELLFGPVLLTRKTPIFAKKWQQEVREKYRVIDQLKQATKNQDEKLKKLQQDIQQIEEVLVND